MPAFRTYLVRGAGVVAALIVVALVVLLAIHFGGANRSEANDNSGESFFAGDSETKVEVIRPHLDPNFTDEATQPANIVPYYDIQLRAKVSGVVTEVTKTIGNHVKPGEPLIVVDVPDLKQDVLKKEAVVEQRLAEKEVAQAKVDRARAMIAVAASIVKEKNSLVKVADATTKFRYQEYRRFRGMASESAITGNVVAEREKFYEAARAESETTRAAVERAQAEVLEAKAKLMETKADEKLKDRLIDVGKSDVKQARALLGYATLTAPFEGQITARNVDPGSFVQSSNGSPGPSLMTIQRTDLLTLYANIPDNYAPYVHPGTRVVIEGILGLPGLQIEARVSRDAGTLLTPSNDRTKRVEVDIYNGTEKAYRAFLKRAAANHYKDLKDGSQIEALFQAGKRQEAERKLPVLPRILGQKEPGLEAPLLSGTYCNMRLSMHNFGKVPLLPSTAMFSKGGKTYLYLVRNGMTQLVAARVVVDNGIQALVSIAPVGQTPRYLRGDDQVVLSNQGELSDGQSVKPTEVGWKFDPQASSIKVIRNSDEAR